MKENELKNWQELKEKVVAFTRNCSDDVKPYILGQLEALTDILREQIEFDKE